MQMRHKCILLPICPRDQGCVGTYAAARGQNSFRCDHATQILG